MPALIIAIGNPNTGKSTVLNSLAGEVLFKSGTTPESEHTPIQTFTHWMKESYKLDKKENEKGRFYDTPGLVDRQSIREAGESISAIIKKSETENVKVLFFVRVQGTPTNISNVEMINIILQNAPEIGDKYGVVINQPSDELTKILEIPDQKRVFLDRFYAAIPRNCRSNRVFYLPYIPAADSEEDKLVALDDLKTRNLYSFKDFLDGEVPIINATAELMHRNFLAQFQNIRSDAELLNPYEPSNPKFRKRRFSYSDNIDDNIEVRLYGADTDARVIHSSPKDKEAGTNDTEKSKNKGEKLTFEGVLKLATYFSEDSGEIFDTNFNSKEILNLIHEAIYKEDFPKSKTYHETIFLMVLNLLFPSLHKKFQECTAIPLTGFRSVEDINAYIDGAIKYGLSAEFNRGAIYVLGNTHVGKTSLVRTLKNFIEKPDENPSFQTKDDECLLETEVVEVHSDIQDRCVPNKISKATISQENTIIFIDKEAKKERDPGEKFIASVYDFGGQTEYFAASQLLIGTSGTFFVCFESTGNLCCDGKGNVRKKEDVKKEYYSSVGTYIDLIVQKAMKTRMEPKIALVATKCDRPSDHLKDVFDLVLDLAKQQVTLMDSEASRVLLVSEILETTTCESLAKNAMIQLHSRIAAILNSPELQTHLNLDMPLSWLKFLDNIRRYESPQIKIKDAVREFVKISTEGEVFSKISDEDALILTKLKNNIVDKIIYREQEQAMDICLQHQDQVEKSKDVIQTNFGETIPPHERGISILKNLKMAACRLINKIKIKTLGPANNNDIITNTEHIESVLNVFSCLGEILYFRDVESLKDIIIPKPMDLIVSLRSTLSHKLIKKLGKSIANHDFIQDLIEKGVLSHTNFSKMCAAQDIEEKSSFTCAEILDFLLNLDLACKFSDDEIILIPSLIQNVNEEKFNNNEARMIEEDNSTCMQYIFDNTTANLLVYSKVLQHFARIFLRGNLDDYLTMSFSQKIENRKLGNVGGITGMIKHREVLYNYILIEYETDSSLEAHESDSSKVCSIARHRGIRFHLKPRNDSNMPHSHAEEIFTQFDKIIQEVAEESPFSRSIVCKNCMKKEKLRPGSFRLSKQIKLKFQRFCRQCGLAYKDPFGNIGESLVTAFQSPVQQSTNIHVNVENLGNLNIQSQTIQNLTVLKQLGIKEVEDASMFLKLLGPNDSEKIQKLTRLQESQVDLSLLKISTLTRSTCLLLYTPPTGETWNGTGFFLAVENFDGLLLVSAGHNMEHNKNFPKDYENFHFYFNNIEGHKKMSGSSATENEDIIPLNLKTIMDEHDCTLVATVDGRQLIKEQNSPRMIKNGVDKKLDYSALIFNDPNIRANMQKKGLRFLQCGSAPDLAPNLGEPLLIFGHPGVDKCNCPAGKCSCTRPLRLTYGQETGSSPNRIEYDMDTLSGNSGSAVTGKACMVKGIHISTSTTKNCNLMLPMEAVLKDLRRLKLLPSNSP